MEKNKKSLISGDIKKHVFNLAWPMSLGILAVLSTSLVDTYFVGQLGTKQLAALSFTFPVALAVNSISIGLGVGASSVVSRIMGKGNRSEASRVTTDTLIMSVLLITIVAILGYFCAKPLFSLLGAKDKVLIYVTQYIQIWFLGLPLLVVPMVSGSIIRALGDSFWPSMQMVFSAFINILLTPAFIFGWWIFPEMGIEGAAYSTIIAWGFTFLFAAYLVHIRENLIVLSKVKIERMIESWKKVLVVGVPSSISQVIHPVSIAVITSFISTYGDDSVAAFGVGTRIESILLIPLFALSAAIPPIAGQNWGAKKLSRIKDALSFSYVICFSWGVLASGTIYFAGESIVSLFTENKSVVNMALLYSKMIVLTIMCYGFLMSASAVFNAIGKPLISFSFSFIRSFVLYIPLSFLALKMASETKIFLAMAAGNTIAGLIAICVTHFKLKNINNDTKEC